MNSRPSWGGTEGFCLPQREARRFNNAQADRDYEDAFREAVRLSPRNALAHYNLGNALYARGQLNAVRHGATSMPGSKSRSLANNTDYIVKRGGLTSNT
jgi:hypothetical protein